MAAGPDLRSHAAHVTEVDVVRRGCAGSKGYWSLIGIVAGAAGRRPLPQGARPTRCRPSAAPSRSRGSVAVEARGWELVIQFARYGLGVTVVNDFCPVPRGLVGVRLEKGPRGRVRRADAARRRARVQGYPGAHDPGECRVSRFDANASWSARRCSDNDTSPRPLTTTLTRSRKLRRSGRKAR